MPALKKPSAPKEPSNLFGDKVTPEEMRLADNPFTDAYWEAELQALNLRRSKFHVEQVEVGWFKPRGNIDDYLNINFRFIETPVPYLIVDDELWMSITPMEVQSLAIPIHRARGNVVTLGLGLGYFALRAAAKPNVQKVTVYEQHPTVIEWFNRAYKDRPELAKIKIIAGDARDVFKGVECDFCFSDIYREMLDDDVISDAKHFKKKNKIERYHFWGYERVIRDLLMGRMLRNPTLYVGRDILSFIHHWARTPVIQGDGDNGMTLGQMNYYPLDTDFLKLAKRQMTAFPM